MSSRLNKLPTDLIKSICSFCDEGNNMYHLLIQSGEGKVAYEIAMNREYIDITDFSIIKYFIKHYDHVPDTYYYPSMNIDDVIEYIDDILKERSINLVHLLFMYAYTKPVDDLKRLCTFIRELENNKWKKYDRNLLLWHDFANTWFDISNLSSYRRVYFPKELTREQRGHPLIENAKYLILTYGKYMIQGSYDLMMDWDWQREYIYRDYNELVEFLNDNISLYTRLTESGDPWIIDLIDHVKDDYDIASLLKDVPDILTEINNEITLHLRCDDREGAHKWREALYLLEDYIELYEW